MSASSSSFPSQASSSAIEQWKAGFELEVSTLRAVAVEEERKRCAVEEELAYFKAESARDKIKLDELIDCNAHLQEEVESLRKQLDVYKSADKLTEKKKHGLFSGMWGGTAPQPAPSPPTTMPSRGVIHVHPTPTESPAPTGQPRMPSYSSPKPGVYAYVLIIKRLI